MQIFDTQRGDSASRGRGVVVNEGWEGAISDTTQHLEPEMCIVATRKWGLVPGSHSNACPPDPEHILVSLYD